MYRTILSRPRLEGDGLAALERRWRHFALVSGASFFQDWTWVGCLAAERYPDPVLLETFREDRLVALALFNRRARRQGGESLYLHESTDPALDSTFIEHNGPLIAIADPVLRQAVLGQLLTRAMIDPLEESPCRPRRLVLSGVAPDCAGAALLTGGFVNESSTRLAPYVDFGLFPASQPFIERLSRNTRHQLRRSNRQYSENGDLILRRAETVETGLDYLADLIRLHNITWHARGKPGAFATPAVRRFYQALIAAGVPNGEVDMLQVTAGDDVVGYLMNFRHRGVVSAYQSGFNYGSARPHQKPGLTCHFLAIDAYRAQGIRVYDFLAGADRYKLSLANAQRWLHWLTVAPRWQARTLGTWVRRLLPA
jgi:hypothetical protein